MRIRIKRRDKSNRREARTDGWAAAPRWLATGTLLAYAAAGSTKPALAQQAGAATASGDQTRTLSVVRFDIPKDTLDVAIRAFRDATGLQVEAAVPDILTVFSPGVTGLYAPDAALKLLLANTEITYKISTSGVYLLELAVVTTTVDVHESGAALTTSMTKFTEGLQDTPQTISAVPQEIMQQQGATTLRDALRNVSGISLAAGEGGAQGDNLTIRGFTARNDLFIDGMRDFGSYYRDPFNTEEVDVLQGPSSITFGRGSTGGVVNQATKSPRLGKFLSGETDFGTDLTRRGTGDINLPVPQLGPGAAFRLNLMGDDANVAGRNVAQNRRFGVAPTLSLGLGTATRWTFSYMYQNAADIPDYGIPWLFNGPAPVNRHNYYGFRDGTYLDTQANIGTIRFEHDVNSRVTIRNQARYANYGRDARITEAKIAGTPVLFTPLSQLTVTRNQIAVNSVESFLDDQLDLITRFQTGSIEHSLVTGVEAGRETSDPTRFTWTGVPGTSLTNPDPTQAFAGTSTISSQVKTTAISSSAYALDTIHLTKKLQFTAGIRWDRFAANYAQTIGPPAAFERTDHMPSWRAGLVYKPVANGTFYAAAGTSFNPSAESLSLSASTANLPPEKNRNYEIGAKWDLRQSRLSLNTALFRTEKLNAREADPTNTLLNVLAGKQRVAGVTVNINGRLTSRWNMLAGYTYLDAKLVQSQFFPASVGAQLANVPAHTFNFWTNYRLPWRTQLSAGGNYVASRTASTTAPLDPTTGLVKAVPGYWVFNAAVSHRLMEHVDLQANVYNIANRYYYDQLHPGHLILGAGRSALVGLKFHF
jgi:catecholate siderophore receptor